MVLSQHEAVIDAAGSGLRRGHSCLYILKKVEIWSGFNNDSQTSKDRATQLLKSVRVELS